MIKHRTSSTNTIEIFPILQFEWSNTFEGNGQKVYVKFEETLYQRIFWNIHFMKLSSLKLKPLNLTIGWFFVKLQDNKRTIKKRIVWIHLLYLRCYQPLFHQKIKYTQCIRRLYDTCNINEIYIYFTTDNADCAIYLCLSRIILSNI